MNASDITCTCGICGERAELLFSRHWAFKAPATYDIYHCANCETRFASPMEVDTDVYDLIYKNAGKIAGYERYERYRLGLRASADPLAYLAQQEDVYWSIEEVLRQLKAQKAVALRILEIGSGFGYLTYALQAAGYDCRGIDISANAVATATRDFGNFYSVKDLMAISSDEGEKFDLIIATELIEHVTAPNALVNKARSLLKPGGHLVLTTPNKDLYSEGLIWHTDPPPVHLWWFSKTSMRNMAWQNGMSVRFIDFSTFYRSRDKQHYKPSKPQTFDEKGEIKYKDTLLNTAARKFVARVPGMFKILARIFIGTKTIGKAHAGLYRDSMSLCLVMKAARISTLSTN